MPRGAQVNGATSEGLKNMARAIAHFETVLNRRRDVFIANTQTLPAFCVHV
jgi:hypothetical protein